VQILYIFGCSFVCRCSVRDRLIESWNDTNQYFETLQAKRISYLSLEFLIGRSMQNALLNMDLETNYREALREMGYDLEKLYEEESDAALGNGGLGRLAACFLDSMATLDLPAWGYGIRYAYGIFKQLIRNGAQVEVPDYWLTFGNPWEIERVDLQYPVRFYGQVRTEKKPDGTSRSIWEGGEIVQAVAYDNPIPGEALPSPLLYSSIHSLLTTCVHLQATTPGTPSTCACSELPQLASLTLPPSIRAIT
jgi:starch phosphorylase